MRAERGFNLIEAIFVMAIIGVLLARAIPAFRDSIGNAKVRAWAESVQQGMQAARNEAIKRNGVVRFQVVDNLTSGCAVAGTGTSWVVSLAPVVDAGGSHCDVVPNPSIISTTATDAGVIQASTAQGADGLQISSTVGNVAANPSVCFSGVGTLVTTDATCANQTTRIDVTRPSVGGDTPLTLRVCVSAPGGSIKICDPSLTNNNPNSAAYDPRSCKAVTSNEC